MPDIFATADRFRADLLRRERSAATELVRAYGIIWQRIRLRLDDLGEQIQQARQRGEDMSPSWLLQFERLQTLQRQVEAEIREFARFAESRIIAEQHEAVQTAQQHAEQLMLAGLGEPPPGVTVTFARLPSGAVQDLVGFLQDGSPLRELLDELGPEASRQVREALIAGVATGQHPTVIARQARQALGGNLVRALTIARTEVLRAYREASRRTYEANRDVVEGWIWHSAANARTCAFCWSMHGSFHRLDERMATHPRCRCAMVPATRSWRDLGFNVPETRVRVPSGPELFARLSEDEQRAILGPAKFAAYRDGRITLEDLRGFRRDARWGRVGYERSLSDILGAERAEAYARLARFAPIAGGALSRADQLILEAATGARKLSRQELQEVLEHVAQAGFEPTPDRRGRTAAEKHFQKHVLRLQEWPTGTKQDEYLASARRILLAPQSSILVSRYKGSWQLTAIGPSGANRGPQGGDWIVVEYRVGLSYWVTVFQPADVYRDVIQHPDREAVRWLRRRL